MNNTCNRPCQNMHSKVCGCPSQRSKMLRNVQKYGFTMVEAGLYLDTHTECRKALEYFERQRNLYKNAVAEYEKKFGPLSFGSDVGCESWKWIQGPWPWEREAN